MQQQHDIIPGFKFPNLNVMLEENGCLVITVYRPITLEVRQRLL